ncbi:MAG: glutamate 5-kinase [Anaerolineales bacterium]|nr:glutamate 5-kinase [Anaerolineales bacterium]
MKYNRVVIKLGTSTLTSGTNRLCMPVMLEIVKQTAKLIEAGCQPVIVTSGAQAAGREVVGNGSGDATRFPSHVPVRQMMSAVGQSHLMHIYSQLFGYYGVKVAQILLTRHDMNNRSSYLNARNTFESLLEYKIVPLVNENDTTSTEEICFGDNDNLSALVANMINADVLLLLTDQEGLYSEDPEKNANANLITSLNLNEITDDLMANARESHSGLGRGGMRSKLEAAAFASQCGVDVRIARGNRQNVILDIAEGKDVGTLVKKESTHLESRKRYLLNESSQTDASITLDKGAVKALLKGSSILPVGINRVSGEFERGAVVNVKDLEGTVVGVGQAHYNSDEIDRLKGIRSTQIRETLGYSFGDEVIHRNDLILFS